MAELVSIDDMVEGLIEAQGLTGPNDVGVSDDAFTRLNFYCRFVGLDQAAFFAGYCLGVVMERRKSDG